MITNIQIDNFKSLVNFNMKLGAFNCLVGLNGSGKSTVLQGMDFISQLMKGDLTSWLKNRSWDAADLNSKLTKKSNIDVTVAFDIEGVGEVFWSASINRTTLHCTWEEISMSQGLVLLSVVDGRCKLGLPNDKDIEDSDSFENLQSHFETESFPIVFKYQGSIISQLQDKQLHPVLKIIKLLLTNFKSLELLSPALLRQEKRDASGSLGMGGEKLSAYLYDLSKDDKKDIASKLQGLYPRLKEFKTTAKNTGEKQLDIVEQYEGNTLKTGARHVNDGLLRMMAVFSQLNEDQSFLLFDEIENGINPELVEALVDELVNTKQQVLITTHSPMILNYLEDDVAKSGITYLYKNKKGHTQAIKLFDIPSMAKKLQFMGPGEAFVDTDLSKLADEIFDQEEA